nr:integrase, catalytic region, zinc finger, CCHC-type, peptidase aspartic, catalytic [Tanacetum cinerariifolium]
MEANNQKIQTILMGLSQDIYAVVNSCQTAKEIWLRVEQMMKDAGQIARNQNRYNTVQNVRNPVVQNAVQNLGVPNTGNQNGVIVVPRIAPLIANQNGNCNVVATRDEANANGNNGNQIRCYNCRGLGHYARNCTVRPKRMDVAYLQTYKHRHRVFRLYTELLDPISEAHQAQQNDSNVIPNVSSIEQSRGTVDQNPTNVEEIRANSESVYNNLAKMNGNITNLSSSTHQEIHNIFKDEIVPIVNQVDARLQAQLGDLKDNTAKTRRPHPRSNTKNDRVPSASKSSGLKNKEVEVEEHHRNLLLFKNKRHISSECNNIKLAIRNDKSEVVCGICKQCLITANDDVCVLTYVNDMNSRDTKQSDNVSNTEYPKKLNLKVKKPKKVGSKERLASPTPSKPSICHRNTCYVQNPKGVDLLKGNHKKNLYTINLYEMAYASPICLIARATSTKSWLRHQRLSYLIFDTINDLAKNDLVTGLPKFRYPKKTFVLHSIQTMDKEDHRDDERLSAMTFEQRSSKLGLQVFKVMYDNYIGSQPSAATRTSHAAQAHQVLETPTLTTTTTDTTTTPTNSSSQAADSPHTSQDVDELKRQQQYV